MSATLQPDHQSVLQYLADETEPAERFISFAPIMDETGLPRQRVRFICRALARKKWASFSQGLWNEDGRPAGSGYAITHVGRSALKIILAYSESPTP